METKKYNQPQTSSVSTTKPSSVEESHVEKILKAPNTNPNLTEIYSIANQSISDLITLLESLPKRSDGRLPDKAILAIGKLHGALIHLKKEN